MKKNSILHYTVLAVRAAWPPAQYTDDLKIKILKP